MEGAERGFNDRAQRAILQVESRRVREVLARRELGHWDTMRALPSAMGDNPRSKAHLLWHLSASGELLIQSDHADFRPEEVPATLMDVAPAPRLHDEDQLVIEVDVTRLYTPSPSHLELPPALRGSKIRLRPVIVPDEWVNEWAEKKLSSWGFNPVL